MSASITVVGSIGKDPEIKFFDSGTAFVNFSVAVSSRKKDEKGNWVDGDTSWFDCTVFDVQAENFANSVQKGSRVVVTGTQTQRKYTDKDGVERTAYNIRVDEVGVSLKWATAEVTRNPKKDGASDETPRAASHRKSEDTSFFSDEPF
jgi:single-strand DNA-binding protein